MEVILILSGIAVVGLAVWFFNLRAAKKRTESLEAVAASLEFSFESEADESLVPSLSGFDLFAEGRSKKASNVMRGQARGIDLVVLDYRYTTGSGKNSHTWQQSVIRFQSNRLRLPRFTLRPENLFHKIGSMFGYQDIDFESHPAFSKAYLLRADDEAACRASFDENVLGFFDERSGLCAEGDQNTLLFYRKSKRVRPDEMHTFLEDGFGVFGAFTVEG